jgi:hypothetical protein
MSNNSENQKEDPNTSKKLFYKDIVEMVDKAFRSKNLLSESNPLPKPPKEATLEVIFIKRN